MSIPTIVLEQYLDFRQYYDELLVLFQDIAGEPYNGEPVTMLVLNEEDIARNMMNMDKNIEAMTVIVYEKSKDFISDFHKSFKRMK